MIDRIASRVDGAWTGSVIAYWLFTLIVVYENLSGFVWWAVNFDYARGVIRHLGYPGYFFDILGPAQLAAAVILIAPGLPIAKEWAYAGALINYSSAVASHVLNGDGLNVFVIAATAYAAFAVASWVLRPVSRRLTGTPRLAETRATSWIAALIVITLMSIASLLTLPLLASLATLLPPL